MNVTPREQVLTMLHQWKEEVDLRAAGTICPMPKCGALVITYDAADRLSELTGASSMEFVCSECGAEFRADTDDLLFKSVPRGWLFAEVSCA